MENVLNNPPTNKLGSGLTEASLLAAVSKSGYPLQTTVANSLRPHFPYLQQEWSYADENRQEVRTIDILAEKGLWDIKQEQPRVRPTLDLLIECKKSELPYVFFLSSSKPWVRHFPLVAGLLHDSLTLVTDDDASSYVMPVLHALGLDSHPFITKEAEYCMSFSKCARKGKGLELTGTESFHGLVLPILKAMRYFQVSESPPRSFRYFDCHLVIGVGVLDAPMVGVRVVAQSHDLVLLPWVRVVRHETDKTADWLQRTKLFAIDVVHKDFFQNYVNEHVLPFARRFSELVLKHQKVLASGKGFASGFGKDGLHNIEQRLEATK